MAILGSLGRTRTVARSLKLRKRRFGGWPRNSKPAALHSRLRLFQHFKLWWRRVGQSACPLPFLRVRPTGCTCDTGPAAAEGRAPPATTEATPAARRRCRASARRAGRSRAAYRCGAPGGREAQLGTVASRAKSRRRCLRQSTSKGDGHRPSSSASSYSCALKRRHTLDILKLHSIS